MGHTIAQTLAQSRNDKAFGYGNSSREENQNPPGDFLCRLPIEEFSSATV